MIDHDKYYTDSDGTPLYAVRPIDPTGYAALVRCDDGRVVDGPGEGPSADLACAMRACPRHSGSPGCGGRLWTDVVS